MESEPSRTAIMTAFARGAFRLEFERPWVLDDPFALVLAGSAWREVRDLTLSVFGVEICHESWAFMCLRSRYTEDRLTQGTFGQYVILGAGLDSFAWRRPDLLTSLKVFEVDHPATQAWKRKRVADLALPLSDALVFVPFDFEAESFADALNRVGFDWSQPTFFSWLGVTMYLTIEGIESTLRTIAGAAPGSEVVFDYSADDSVLDNNSRKMFELLRPIAAASGEPLQGHWSTAGIEEIIRECGLEITDHPTREETIQRYFADRTDGLVPWTALSLATARIARS
jgi:methyltransferase (TIGR00027 family)